MRCTRRTFWWILAGPLVVLGAILVEAWPFLAITRPNGSHVLVVEGWMEPAPMAAAARLALDSGYVRIYTTGTVRPFTCYLDGGGKAEVQLQDAAQGNLDIAVAGGPGAAFSVIADGDTVIEAAAPVQPRTFHAELRKPVRRLSVVAHRTGLPAGHPVLFIRSFAIGGINIAHLQARAWSIGLNRDTVPVWPTYAGAARAKLITLGVPAERITAVPALGWPRSRSWGNAHAFAVQARMDGITAFDVATAGIHARRSRSLFQTACGPGVRVGVIALPDPRCTRASWWKTRGGWAAMVKEVVGAPEAEAVAISR